MVAIVSAHPSLAFETSVVRRIAQHKKPPTPTERSDEIRRSLHALERPPLKTTDVEAYQAEMLKKHNGLRFEFGSLNRFAIALEILTCWIFIASLVSLFFTVLLGLVLPLNVAISWLAVICPISMASVVTLYIAGTIWGDPTEQPSNIYLERSYWTRENFGAVSTPYWLIGHVNTLARQFPDLRFKVDRLVVSRKQLLPDPLLLAILPDDSIVYLDGWNLERDIERES